MEDEILRLEDPELKTVYTLRLSGDDFTRAEHDEEFANSLLRFARINYKVDNIEHNIRNDDTRKDSEVTLEILDESVAGQSSKHSDDNSNRAVWTYNETLTLIRVMATHLEDMNHPTKRKVVFERAANDMISAGYAVSIEMLKNKWKGLNRSYTKAKDTKNLTGRGPSRFMFFNEMDEVLGERPTNKCTHSLNSNELPSNEEVNEPPINGEDDNEQDIGEQGEIFDDRVAETPQTSKTQRLSEKRLKKEYIEKKEEEYRRRQKRHEERVQLEQEKIEIERQKLEILKKLLGKK